MSIFCQFIIIFFVFIYQDVFCLKGKFSSGIEGALASTLNHDFNRKQLSEMILWIFFDVFKVYLSNIDSEQEKYNKKRILGVGVAFYYDLKYKVQLDTSSERLIFSRMHNIIVSLLCKRPHESNVALTDVWSYLSNLRSVNRF